MAQGVTFYLSDGVGTAKYFFASRHPLVGARIKVFFRNTWMKAVIVKVSCDERGHYFLAKTEEYINSSFLDGYGLLGPLSSARPHLWIFEEENPNDMDPLYLEHERPMTAEELEACNDENLPF